MIVGFNDWQPVSYPVYSTGSNTISYTTSGYYGPTSVDAAVIPLPPEPPTVIDWLRGRVSEITELAWAA